MKTLCWMISVSNYSLIRIPRLVQWLTLIGLAIFLTACKPEQSQISGSTMGTHYLVKYVAHKQTVSITQLQMEIDQRLEDVNAQMSTYRPDSELSQFNHSRQVNKPFPVSQDLITVINEAIRINKLTEGGLDITVGPLVNLWGFGPEKRNGQLPNEIEIAQRRSWTGIDKIEVQQQALIKKIPQLYLDLSAIAKGFAVDLVAELLEQHQIHDYLVDIGGEVRTKGKNARSQPWRIAIEKPVGGLEQTVQEVIEPGTMAVATSGDYRNYFEENGVRYSHTIHPGTGKPINHRLVSVTVLNPTCMTADGLATGFNVLGPEKSLQLANQYAIPVFMIVKTDEGFEERYSEAFRPYLQQKNGIK